MNKDGEDMLMDSNLSFEEKIERLDELKEMWKDFDSNFDKELEKMRKTMPSHPIIDEFIIPMLKNMPSILFIFIIPKAILEKLGNLWAGYEGAKMALDIFSKFNKK